MIENNNWPDPARPGVPMNPDRDGWHWLEWMDYCGTKPTGIIDQFKWERDGYWDRTTHRSARYWACWRYLGPCLTPAEVDARIKEAEAQIAAGCLISNAAEVADLVAKARGDALEEAALWHDEQERFWMEKGREVSKFDMRIGLDLHLKAGDHRKHAAAIRALKGEGDD